MTERFVLTSEKIGKHWEILITDYQTDEPFDDTSYDATDNYQDTLDNMEDLCLLLNQIHKENEQLKQFKEDVFNKIDMHLRMLPTARDNEFNEENGDPSLYVGAIYMLETLKKELEE